MLFERYYVPVARFFRGKVPDVAEELIQRTFVALVESQQRVNDTRSVTFGACEHLHSGLS